MFACPRALCLPVAYFQPPDNSRGSRRGSSCPSTHTHQHLEESDSMHISLTAWYPSVQPTTCLPRLFFGAACSRLRALAALIFISARHSTPKRPTHSSRAECPHLQQSAGWTGKRSRPTADRPLCLSDKKPDPAVSFLLAFRHPRLARPCRPCFNVFLFMFHVHICTSLPARFGFRVWTPTRHATTGSHRGLQLSPPRRPLTRDRQDKRLTLFWGEQTHRAE